MPKLLAVMVLLWVAGGMAMAWAARHEARRESDGWMLLIASFAGGTLLAMAGTMLLALVTVAVCSLAGVQL